MPTAYIHQKHHIESVIQDRWVDWYIDNTEKVIKVFEDRGRSEENDKIIKRYAKLLKLLHNYKNGIIDQK